MNPVDFSKVAPFYHTYIKLVEGNGPVTVLEQYGEEWLTFLKGIEEERWNYAYAPGKWTIKELVQHIIDAERIFAYRALRIGRRDQTPLPGFDEEAYTPTSKAARRSKESLIHETKTVREATILLFQSFDADDLAAEGIASDSPTYVNAIAFIIAGHAKHHQSIITERYLHKKAPAA